MTRSGSVHDMLLAMAHAADPFKYQIVIDHIRALVNNGLPRGSRLPTERELADQLGVSRVSVRRAFDELEATDEVRRVQGSGTFVEGPSVDKGVGLRSFTQEMASRGSRPGAQVLSAVVKPVSSDVGWLLGVPPGEPVVELRRVRTADGIPMCIETDTLPERLVPGLLEQDLRGSLYDLLKSQHGIELASVKETFRATTLSPEVAELLSVPPHSPALEMSHIAYASDGTAVHSSLSLYRGDRYSVTVEQTAAGWLQSRQH